METCWEINTPAPMGEDIRHLVVDLVARLDSVYSRFCCHSLVSRIATAVQGGTLEFPREAAAIFDLYHRLQEATDGAIDPLVGRDLELLGHYRHYSLISKNTEMAAAPQRPALHRDIQVKATLREGVITAVTVTPHGLRERSLELQCAFAATVTRGGRRKAYHQVSAGKLAGSNSTPNGFNDASRQTRKQAAGG